MLRLRIVRLGLVGVFFSAQIALGSTIAIIDSGTDIKHPELESQIWTNPLDGTPDGRDNDGNGFIDDMHGWSFLNNSNKLIDMKYSSLYNADIETYFQVQDDYLLGKATKEQIDWIKAKVADAAFIKNLSTFGAFVHGTHVAGITVRNNPDAKVLTVRLVPVENPLLGMVKDIEKARAEGQAPSTIVQTIIKGGLFVLAKLQGQPFALIGTYIHSTKADVANASIGVGMMQARMIIGGLVKLANGGKEADAATVDALAIYFVNRTVVEQGALASNSPDTLFVFAAGNDGTNNDIYPTSPANIGAENTMSIGASIETSKIAPFSNFGQKVDVFAPGVAIMSTIPGGGHITLSGTSQASPYVAGVAAHLKDINTALKPAEMKQIIIGTVDVRADLKDKALSSGIVNEERALYAAQQSLNTSVSEAIANARQAVSDMKTETTIDAANATPFRFFEPTLLAPVQ